MKRKAITSAMNDWEHKSSAEKTKKTMETVQAPADPKPAAKKQDHLIHSAQAFLAHVGSCAA